VVETTRSPLDVLIPPRRALVRSEKDDSGNTESISGETFWGFLSFQARRLYLMVVFDVRGMRGYARRNVEFGAKMAPFLTATASRQSFQKNLTRLK
jgi:hypothetical protein